MELEKLNFEQLNTYNQCINTSSHILCHGKASVGKTLTEIQVLKHFDNARVSVISTEYSHDFCDKLCFSFHGDIKDKLYDMKVMIIDGIHDVDPTFLCQLHTTLIAHLTSKTLLFGGIRIILFGDFSNLNELTKLSYIINKFTIVNLEKSY